MVASDNSMNNLINLSSYRRGKTTSIGYVLSNVWGKPIFLYKFYAYDFIIKTPGPTPYPF
jgi:hypothetical protein